MNKSENLEKIRAEKPVEDPLSRLEESDIDKEAKRSFHKVSAKAINILGWTVIIIAEVSLLIRAWHLLASEKYQWLSASNIEKIDHIIVAIMAGLVARFFPGSRE